MQLACNHSPGATSRLSIYILRTTCWSLLLIGNDTLAIPQLSKEYSTQPRQIVNMSNKAAFLDAEKAYPLSVRGAPYPAPGAADVVVRIHAVAVNPIDWKLQSLAFFALQYPHVLGKDAAGEVVEVGSDVKGISIGQRVLAYTHRTGAFQQYVAVPAHMAAIIPDTMSYQEACVLPLAMATSSAGLYQKTHLALEHPTTLPKPLGKTVLVWGGSSSIGTSAIQPAKASGYDVVATASQKNFGHIRDLGTEPFSYADPNVVDDIVAYLDGKTVAGAYDCVVQGDATAKYIRIVKRTAGSGRVATVDPSFKPSDWKVSKLWECWRQRWQTMRWDR